MTDRYTSSQYALHARKFLNLGPKPDDRVAADEIERTVRKITEHAPPGSPAARHTDNVVIAARGWFLGGQPTPIGLHERKASIAAMIIALEERAQEFDDGTPH